MRGHANAKPRRLWFMRRPNARRILQCKKKINKYGKVYFICGTRQAWENILNEQYEISKKM